MRIFILSIACFLLVSPFIASADDLNAGFVQGFWYSSESMFVDEPIRMYVALRNNTDNELSGRVTFKDGDTPIGTKNVQALSGRLVEAWTDWTPTYGEHKLTATIDHVTLYPVGAEPVESTVSSALAEDTIFIDFDTDKDGVGNKEDEADDAAGISDTTETQNGTDPLVFDEPVVEEKEETESNIASVTEADSTDDEDTSSSSVESDGSEGLERFLNDGTINRALSSVTETISTTKQKLDSYRESRAEKYKADSLELSTDPRSVTNMLAPSISSVENSWTPTEYSAATITRYRIDEKPSFTKRAFGAGLFIIGSIYTLLLNLLSLTLAHPAIVEVLLLLGILYIIFHFARKLGRRPGD